VRGRPGQSNHGAHTLNVLETLRRLLGPRGLDPGHVEGRW
jgi:hypothetical protein